LDYALPFRELVAALQRLPGIGQKTAPRLAFHDAGINDLADLRVAPQRPCHRRRVGAMDAHAQWQGFETLDVQERVERARRRPEVAEGLLVYIRSSKTDQDADGIEIELMAPLR